MYNNHCKFQHRNFLTRNSFQLKTQVIIRRVITNNALQIQEASINF